MNHAIEQDQKAAMAYVALDLSEESFSGLRVSFQHLYERPTRIKQDSGHVQLRIIRTGRYQDLEELGISHQVNGGARVYDLAQIFNHNAFIGRESAALIEMRVAGI
jgi:hypothetical protein